jgi:hypothetical protein
MYKNRAIAGSISAVFGALICFVAVLARLADHYYLAGYQSTTMFSIGVGMVVSACLVKFESLPNKTRQ